MYIKSSSSRLVAVEKTNFSIKDFFSKCDQICSFLWILSHLLKKSLMENFAFCAVSVIILGSRKDHQQRH